MLKINLFPLLILGLAACSQSAESASATPDAPLVTTLENRLIDGNVPGLRVVGSVKEVPESSGLVPGPRPNTYYSFGDNGNKPRIYLLDDKGSVLEKIDVAAKNHDWESMTRDNQGTYFIGDCGNNNSDRKNLKILRLDPAKPDQVGQIKFTYPDQDKFPPKKKKDREFDCEATLWRDGRIWLFTKDANEKTCHVYSVPDQPGEYEAKKETNLKIDGRVTDATLSPDGTRLVLLARAELFILDGKDWDSILDATPYHISLRGAGQTEGVAFKDAGHLLICTEQGKLYEYDLPVNY